jgi:hypothetical protein
MTAHKMACKLMMTSTFPESVKSTQESNGHQDLGALLHPQEAALLLTLDSVAE